VNWNSGAERLLGFAEEEIIGQSSSVFFTPEDVAHGQVEREFDGAARDGRSEDERWHVRKNGTRFCANVSMNGDFMSARNW
jgi:PAS domain S-box-containing protein